MRDHTYSHAQSEDPDKFIRLIDTGNESPCYAHSLAGEPVNLVYRKRYCSDLVIGKSVPHVSGQSVDLIGQLRDIVLRPHHLQAAGTGFLFVFALLYTRKVVFTPIPDSRIHPALFTWLGMSASSHNRGNNNLPIMVYLYRPFPAR